MLFYWWFASGMLLISVIFSRFQCSRRQRALFRFRSRSVSFFTFFVLLPLLCCRFHILHYRSFKMVVVVVTVAIWAYTRRFYSTSCVYKYVRASESECALHTGFSLIRTFRKFACPFFFIGFCLFNKIAFARNSCELHDVISLFMNTEKARDLKWNVCLCLYIVFLSLALSLRRSSCSRSVHFFRLLLACVYISANRHSYFGVPARVC